MGRIYTAHRFGSATGTSDPRDLGTPAGWWRADLGVTLNGSDVSTWADISGNGVDLSQGTGANQPLWVASGTYGQPCIRFTAANSDVLFRNSTNLFGTGAYTVAMVVSCPDSGAEKGLFANRDSGGAGGIVLEKNNANQRDAIHIGVSLHTDGTQGTGTEIWVVTRAAASVPSLFINGVAQSVGGAPTGLNNPGASAVLSIGAYFSGGAFTAFSGHDAYEAVAYTSALSTGDRRRLEQYFHTRYGIPV